MADDNEELLQHYLHGPLSADDLAQVSALAADRNFVDRLVRTVITHDFMRRRAAARRGLACSRQIHESFDSLVRLRADHSQGIGRRLVARPVLWGAAAAIVVASTLAVWLNSRGEHPAETARLASHVLPAATGIARFSRSVNVEWEAHARRWAVGDRLREADRLDLAAGCAELQFDSGALMTIVGPAALELRSMSAVELLSGTATTRVENAESGEFRVFTHSTDVIDRGTEFGVRVLPDGKTDVVVFEGEVELKPAQARGTEGYTARRLSIGEAVSTSGAGDWHRLVAVQSDAFPFGDAMFQYRRTRPPVIVGISDDRRSASSPKFYRIYHEGLSEDARAFVDRCYEWNGITADGIAGFLRNADYIATFNDDKTFDSPLISVELAVPATLYIFYDDRMVAPDWLVGDFEDTGFDIGIDELNTGVGPGVTVDQTCSIWRRRIEQAGGVQLGRIGPQKGPQPLPGAPSMRAMYGIAAQPL